MERAFTWLKRKNILLYLPADGTTYKAPKPHSHPHLLKHNSTGYFKGRNHDNMKRAVKMKKKNQGNTSESVRAQFKLL